MVDLATALKAASLAQSVAKYMGLITDLSPNP